MSIEINSGFDAKELLALDVKLMRLAGTTYRDEAKKFLKEQGNKGRKTLRKKTKEKTKKKTGNLLKGIGRRQPDTYAGSLQIRVYNKAPHAHLIEHGHVMADKFGNPILNGAGEEMWVPGKHPAAETTNELKAVFHKEVDAFVDDLLKKGLDL